MERYRPSIKPLLVDIYVYLTDCKVKELSYHHQYNYNYNNNNLSVNSVNIIIKSVGSRCMEKYKDQGILA